MGGVVKVVAVVLMVAMCLGPLTDCKRSSKRRRGRGESPPWNPFLQNIHKQNSELSKSLSRKILISEKDVKNYPLVQKCESKKLFATNVTFGRKDCRKCRTGLLQRMVSFQDLLYKANECIGRDKRLRSANRFLVKRTRKVIVAIGHYLQNFTDIYGMHEWKKCVTFNKKQNRILNKDKALRRRCKRKYACVPKNFCQAVDSTMSNMLIISNKLKDFLKPLQSVQSEANKVRGRNQKERPKKRGKQRKKQRQKGKGRKGKKAAKKDRKRKRARKEKETEA